MNWEYCPECGSNLDTADVEGRNRLYCRSCSQVIWKNPKPVAWLLAQREEKYLLVKRAHNPDKGTWDIPGGFLELEESFRQGAAREFEEETGIAIDAEQLDLFTTLSFGRDDEQVVGLVFHTEIDKSHDDIDPGPEIREAQFWDVGALETSEEKLRPVCKPVLRAKK